MYIRGTTLHGDPQAMGAAVHYVRTRLRPTVDPLAGSLGLGMWLNRETGRCYVATAWKDEAAVRAADKRLATRDAELACILDHDLRIAVLEPVLFHQGGPERPGYWCRFIEVTLRPALLDRAIWLADSQLGPALRRLDGFAAFTVYVDRASDTFVAAVTVDSRRALEASRAGEAARREGFLAPLGSPDWEGYELEVEISGIAPPVELPSQRAADEAAHRPT